MSTSAPQPLFFDLSSLGLAQSASQYLQQWLVAMQAAFGPEFSPGSADLDYIQAVIFSSWAADVAQLCNQGATELFRQFGTQLLNLPYENGTPAQAIINVTAVDDAGYTLPLFSQLLLTLNGSQVGFQTASTLTIPPLSTSGQVTAIALATGSSFNGAGAPAEMNAQTNWISSLTVVTNASGGVDQEDDDSYLVRLANTLTTLKPSLVTASDAAALALDFVPAVDTDQQEVGRATAIDGYDPTSHTYGNERELTTCVTDASGNALNSDTMTAVQAYLANYREVNFIINVIAPAYSTIYFAVTVNATAGYTAATIRANVQAAVLNYLNPINFGLPQGAVTGWDNSQVIRLSRVESIVQLCQGVDSIVPGTMAIDLNPNPTNTTNDLQLLGAFTLPITSTASVPLSGITVLGA